MRELDLRAQLGLGLVGTHFFLLLLIGILAAIDRFTPEEMFTAFGIVAPLFAAYTTVIIRGLVQEHSSYAGPRTGAAGALLVLGVPSFFALILLLATFWKAFGSLGFTSYVKLVGLSETLVGVYVGMIVETFFGRPAREGAANTAAPADQKASLPSR